MSARGDALELAGERPGLRDRLLAQPLVRIAGFVRGYRLQAALTVLAMVVFTGTGLVTPYLFKLAIDGGIRQGDLGYLTLIGALYLVTGIVGAGVHGLQTYGVNWVGERIVRDLRDALFRHFTALDVPYHTRQRAGWAISRLTNDIEALEQLLTEGATSLVTNVLTLVGAVIILFTMDAGLAAITLTVVPLLAVVTVVYRAQSTRAYRRVRNAVADVTAALQEGLSGIRVVQAFGREDQNRAAFGQVNDAHRRAELHSALLSGGYFPGVELLSALATALILLYGGRQVARGEMTVGVLAAFIAYLSSFFAPVESLSELYTTFQSARAAMEKVFGVLDTPPDEAEVAGALAATGLRGDLLFESVSFAYDPEADEVLDDVCLHIPAGQRVALVGATGAGKTTLARLLLRFYLPTAGRILVDGVELGAFDVRSYRRHIGYVPQEPYLFSGTVADNIRLTDPQADGARVRAAARSLGVDDLFVALPEGYDTQVQERGSRLSAGERQLVAFARAFFAQPAILILDEATSSIDPGTERRTELALARLLRGRTSLVIAHRLSTVQHSDRILVLEEGRIVEDGSHEQLLGAQGPYARLYQAQLQTSPSLGDGARPPGEETA